MLRSFRPRAAALVSVCLLAPGVALGDAASDVGGSAPTAKSEAALSRLADRLTVHAKQLSSPPQLESGVDALGKLVVRGRELEVGAALFERLTALGATFDQVAGGLRDRLENSAGEDEAALERLFESEDWQRLDYANTMIGYWTGWAQLSRAQVLPAGEERRAAMRAAQTALARSAHELRLPQIATASLLGIGVAQHDLGDLAAARRTLSSLESRLALGDEGGLRDSARYELALVALKLGDVEDARRAAAGIADLSAEQRLALSQLEVEAWLRRAKKRDGEGADDAAALLRDLAGRGGEAARWSAAVAAENWELLRGRDVGPIGALLDAEAHFEAGRYAQARDAYARVLAADAEIPGLDGATARFQYARSLAQTGDTAAAAGELEHLLARGGGAPVRAPAASLFYSLAEQLARDRPGTQANARAAAAARILLDARPNAPGADVARLRLARATGKTPVAELEKIPQESPAYAAARLELARARSDRLQRLETSGRISSKSGREQAHKLAADLDAVARLVESGRLEPDLRRDATMAVLRAKAAVWSGADAEELLARVETASARPGLGAEGRRALLRLKLHALSSENRDDELSGLLTERSAEQLRAEWPIWNEALSRLVARPGPAAMRLVWIERLVAVAPASARTDLALDHARALLDAGRAAEALAEARALVVAHPGSGDAWQLVARALDATGPPREAAEAWQKVANGVEVGGARWVRAQLASAAAARRVGDAASACARVAELSDALPDPDPATRRLIDAAAQGCATGGTGTRPAPARSGARGPPSDPR